MNVNYISSHSMFMENVPLNCLLSLENETPCPSTGLQNIGVCPLNTNGRILYLALGKTK